MSTRSCQGNMEEARRLQAKARLIRLLIKESDAYQALYRKLQEAMTRAWTVRIREAVRSALEFLRSKGPERATEEDLREALARIEQIAGGEAMRRLLEGPLIDLVPAIYGTGAQEATRALGIDFTFGLADKRALEILHEGNLFWVGQHWDRFTGEMIQGALREFFEAGRTRDELADLLERNLSEIVRRGKPYWELLADHVATKTREMGRVSGYEQAGIEWVQIRAHLDERTTKICRSLHGRVIAVRRLRAQVDHYLEAIRQGDLEGAKRAWKMHTQEDFSQTPSSRLPTSVGLPPYHFRCRTITVAYLEGGGIEAEQPVDRWKRKTYDREPLSRKELEALIEWCKGARWNPRNLKEHWQSHQRENWKSLEEYNRALELIRRGDRNVYLVIRDGELRAIFWGRMKRRKNATPVAVIIDVRSRRIITIHKRKRITPTKKDEVPPVLQPKARGIQKWLGNWIHR